MARHYATKVPKAGTVGTCTVSVTQPAYLEVDYTHKDVTIVCTFSLHECIQETPAFLWFRYGKHQSENLCSSGCQREADKFTLSSTSAQNQVSLTINRLSVNDSAIYICGVASTSAADPHAKQTGRGTTLVVRESKLLSQEVRSIFIALLVLLSVYITGVGVIVTVLSRKKSARRIFQDIAQELYHKRYVETNQQPEKDNTVYENRRVRSNSKRP
ncbi:immunoglobulin superfamily member 6 [Rhynchocyon petersi]